MEVGIHVFTSGAFHRLAGRKNVTVILGVLMLIAVAVSGCASKGANAPAETGQGTPVSGGALIIGMESEADQLDPHRGVGWVTMRINNQIYEPLVAEDLSKPSDVRSVPDLVPALATSWKVSDDGLVYTFTLRKNVTFHDGTPFDASAVIFNIRRLTDKSFQYYDKIGASKTFRTWLYYESAKEIDPSTVEIRLKKPFPDFLRVLAQINSLQIVSPAAIQKYGNDGLGDHPVGTGPFRFDSRVRGQSITLVRNDNYWGPKPYLDKVIFRPLPDPASRVLALQNHEVDIIAVPPPDALDKLKSQGFQVVSGRPPHVWYLAFNFQNQYMKSKDVRQAINYAIDREGLAKDLLKGTVQPAYTIQSPANIAYDPSKKWYLYDPEKAKQLLAKAGYPNGFETTLMTSVDGSGQLLPVPMAEWIQRNLAAVGIRVKLDTREWISYLSGYTNGMPPEVGMNQMSSGRTTPYFLAMIAHSKFKAPGGFNSGQYVNPQLDDVMDRAATARTQEESVALWKQAEKIVMEDAAFAPIVNDTAPYVLAPQVHGFIVPAEEWYNLSTVWLTK
ncbi:peptide ABC transporter substrate-binding protein [Kyrpidia spormannii]|uniref:Peptide ABC transporter substrate-binding protein n=1 Tax=Kyrpidia spormannii TaxID=2055160 RepID=A0A2K8N971_9BACL|nr:peptide ABC transporter substrate-binding protein [Kyrpidia spormannii]